MKEETAVGKLLVFTPLVSPMLVIKPEIVLQVTELCAEALLYHEVTAANYDAANEFYSRLTKMAKTLEKDRETVKNPVLALGRAIDAAVKEQTAGLLIEKGVVEKQLAIEIRRQEAERQAAQREVERVEREAREKAEQAIKDGNAFAALQAQQTIVEAKQEQVILKDAGKGQAKAISIAQIDKLFIDDASKIPYSINGVVLTMPIESAIKALIQGGVSVPGCHIEKVDSFRSRG